MKKIKLNNNLQNKMFKIKYNKNNKQFKLIKNRWILMTRLLMMKK